MGIEGTNLRNEWFESQKILQCAMQNIVSLVGHYDSGEFLLEFCFSRVLDLIETSEIWLEIWEVRNPVPWVEHFVPSYVAVHISSSWSHVYIFSLEFVIFIGYYARKTLKKCF